MRKFVIGLTGGIASGKSEVSKILSSHGCYVLDADLIAREVVAPNTKGLLEIAEQFPDSVSGGSLDRAKLKEIVFADKSKLARLNAITHPLIISTISKRLNSSPCNIAVIDAPLLFETDLHHEVDSIWVVVREHAIRKRSLMARDRISAGLAESIMSSQLTDAQLTERADVIIDNNDSLAMLTKRVLAALAECKRATV